MAEIWSLSGFPLLKHLLTCSLQYEDKTTQTLMMLPTDMVLVQDKKFKPWTEKYAKDNDLFFKDFSAVVTKLFELGVPFAEGTENQRWNMKPTWDESK